MRDSIPVSEIKDTLAAYYRDLYEKHYLLRNEATAAQKDDDIEAFNAITRRANKQSDFMNGILEAAYLLGIPLDEFMEAVNADQSEEA